MRLDEEERVERAPNSKEKAEWWPGKVSSAVTSSTVLQRELTKSPRSNDAENKAQGTGVTGPRLGLDSSLLCILFPHPPCHSGTPSPFLGQCADKVAQFWVLNMLKVC